MKAHSIVSAKELSAYREHISRALHKQPEHTVQAPKQDGDEAVKHERCLHCFRPMDKRAGAKFCGKICRSLASLKRRGKAPRKAGTDALARPNPHKQTEGVCLHCGKRFFNKRADAKFCSVKCRSLHTRTTANIKCVVCGRSTKSYANGFSRFCSDECKHKAKEKRKADRENRGRGKKQKPKGSYVYVWKDDGQVFYVGKGVGDRAWQIHYATDDKAKCEIRRQNSRNFEVVIIRDSLTDDGAVLIESTLIKLLNPECNVQHGSSREFTGSLTFA